jgi:thiamine pyrophosphokinase
MNIPVIRPCRTVILANGTFPSHTVPLSFLRDTMRRICCDGATESLLQHGLEPHFIVGDLDSISTSARQRYRHCLLHDPDQNHNDLTKAVRFCMTHHWTDITIVGATGKREDHSLANISLLADYAADASVQMLTDYGVFVPALQSSTFESFKGQQVSVFSLTPDSLFTVHGLKYPIVRRGLSSWWQGSLNESCGDKFSIDMDRAGKILIFREYRQLLHPDIDSIK